MLTAMTSARNDIGSAAALSWELVGTRGATHAGTDPIRLSWTDGVLEGPRAFVDEWRRLCEDYAGGKFFVMADQPLRISPDPATDPVVSFVIAVHWLPIWVDEVRWHPEVPRELEGWAPRPRNVLPIAIARIARRSGR